MAVVYGVHEKWAAPDNGRTPTQVKAFFTNSKIGRCFVGGTLAANEDLRPKVDEVIAPYLTASTNYIYVSLKTDITQTRQGTWNARFQELGAHLVSVMASHPGVTIKLVWWHEPEDDMDGTAFAHAFNKVRLNTQLGGPGVKVCYSSMAYHWALNGSGTASIGGKTDDVAAWKNVVADEYCTDVYSGRSFPLDKILPEHPGFARWFSAFLPPGANFTVTERGFETPNSAPNPTHNATANYPLRNATIAREADWLYNNPVGQRCQFYIYWNSSGTEESASLRLDTTGEQALISAFNPAPSQNNGGSSMQYTPINDIPWPELVDEPNIEEAVKPAVEHIDTRVVPRFGNSSTRTLKITSPTQGMVCWVNGLGLQVYSNSSVWVPFPGTAICKVNVTNFVVVADNTPYDVPFDNDLYDPFGCHSTSSNPTRVNLPFPGWYQISGAVAFPTDPGSTYTVHALLKKNGVSISGGHEHQASPRDNSATASTLINSTGSDYIELEALHTVGVGATPNDLCLSVIYAGPSF